MRIDIRELDQRATLASVRVVERITLADLGRPTPCAAWNLGDLLAHMTVQHLGFAAAASGRGAAPEVWLPQPPGPDPVADYRDAAQRVLAAFAGEDVPEREFRLPEISTATGFPGRQAIGFHCIDYVVHGWDVSRSLALPYPLDPDLLAAALELAATVPGGERRLVPGAAFAPGVTSPDGAGPLDRVVAMLGRSPDWAA
jgi:uncharacterized protein (TIGR03086 family)